MTTREDGSKGVTSAADGGAQDLRSTSTHPDHLCTMTTRRRDLSNGRCLDHPRIDECTDFDEDDRSPLRFALPSLPSTTPTCRRPTVPLPSPTSPRVGVISADAPSARARRRRRRLPFPSIFRIANIALLALLSTNIALHATAFPVSPSPVLGERQAVDFPRGGWRRSPPAAQAAQVQDAPARPTATQPPERFNRRDEVGLERRWAGYATTTVWVGTVTVTACV